MKSMTNKVLRERANKLFKKMIVDEILEEVETEITEDMTPKYERVFVRLSGHFSREIKNARK